MYTMNRGKIIHGGYSTVSCSYWFINNQFNNCMWESIHKKQNKIKLLGGYPILVVLQCNFFLPMNKVCTGQLGKIKCNRHGLCKELYRVPSMHIRFLSLTNWFIYLKMTWLLSKAHWKCLRCYSHPAIHNAGNQKRDFPVEFNLNFNTQKSLHKTRLICDLKYRCITTLIFVTFHLPWPTFASVICIGLVFLAFSAVPLVSPFIPDLF